MFGLFDKKYNNPELLETISQTQEKWFAFLDKLEQRMDELCSSALPEIREVFNQDKDPYKRAHGHMLLGIRGQISQMRNKANAVREEKITHFIDVVKAGLPDFISFSGREYHDKLMVFRINCINRHQIFEDKIARYNTLLEQATGGQDLETAYQQELEAFENIRDKFSCKQCGGQLTISKIFFIAAYITCPYCQTQNTFTPSTGAQMVLHRARSLAEQRTAHLLKFYEESKPENKSLYRQYLRAMFNEWNKIVPDMTEENEKFYQRMLQDHLNSIHHY